jgi:hypothetical protein
VILSRLSLAALSLSLFVATIAEAASVANIKGQRVLINLEGDSASPGDEFFLVDPNTNKRRAVVRISQVRGGKAIADLMKGSPAVGQTLQARGGGGGSSGGGYSSPVASDSGSDNAVSNRLRPAFGIMGHYLMNSMEAQQKLQSNATNTSSMNGSGFGVGGFYDYVFSSDIIARGTIALEQFTVSGKPSNTSGCNGSGTCDAKFMYLSFYGLAKYHLTKGDYRPWIGAGGGLLLAMSKESSILNASQVSTNQVFVVGAGMDIQRGRKNAIPVSVEYALFPPSDTVKASMILLKAGWAWNL